MSRPPARRRQRSVRVTAAASLLVLASAGLLATLPMSDPVPLRVAAAAALVLGWAAARILHQEVVTSRREHARDRARQARAFSELLAVRSVEHASLSRRLAGREREVRELEATVRLVERRALHAEGRLRRGALEPVDHANIETVVDLLAWEEQARTGRSGPQQRKHA